MPGEARMIRFDADLHIEACWFHGLLQDFHYLKDPDNLQPQP